MTQNSDEDDVEEAEDVESSENEVEDGGDDSTSDSSKDEAGGYQIDGTLILCLNLFS